MHSWPYPARLYILNGFAEAAQEVERGIVTAAVIKGDLDKEHLQFHRCGHEFDNLRRGVPAASTQPSAIEALRIPLQRKGDRTGQRLLAFEALQAIVQGLMDGVVGVRT